tara:strand:+ start:1660 stop:2529 length:870 start_codon:yes stop_codon:yes gene_type:complete
MKIKYLLSGRLFADLTHIRRFVDIWPNDYPFPELVSDLSEIKGNDIVFTYGYLGCSVDLILRHDPEKVYIFDNSIFNSYGQKYFRLLNGNLETIVKKEQSNSNYIFNYYKRQITKTINRLKANKIDISDKKLDAELPINNFDLQLPWSVPIKNIIKSKDDLYINIFEKNKLNFIKNKVINLPKKNNIDLLSNKHIPIFRGLVNNRKRKYDIDKYISRCSKMISPTSTLSMRGILLKKEIYISKYNPLSNFIIENPNFNKYNQKKLIYLLTKYLCSITYNIREIYEHLEY